MFLILQPWEARGLHFCAVTLQVVCKCIPRNCLFGAAGLQGRARVSALVVFICAGVSVGVFVFAFALVSAWCVLCCVCVCWFSLSLCLSLSLSLCVCVFSGVGVSA